LGEAAALPPVTAEDQPDLLATLAPVARALVGRSIDAERIAEVVDELALGPVAAAGLECALIDASARLAGVPMCSLYGGEPVELVTDITLPIGDPDHLAELAARYQALGFRALKLKVGKSLEQDIRAIEALATSARHCSVRLDANGGYGADQALTLLEAARRHSVAIDCFEQPCGKDDLAGMGRVVTDGGVPVIADESCTSIADVDRLVRQRAATAVNLKLAKMGGVSRALAIGRHARARGLRLMAGAMVETRLGLCAMAHVVAALGGVDWLDLDTAFLLADDPFDGGYLAHGPRLTLLARPGLGIEPRPSW
jgi:L-alanine-DL-glutamate epimerase-like enolase superfamily enzyme